MENCIFCKISNGETDTKLIYSDQHIVVFNDINPKADVHLLFIPKIHITSLKHLEENHRDLVAHMMFSLVDIAKEYAPDGFRTIINTDKAGGQEVPHLHLHLLSGNLRIF